MAKKIQWWTVQPSREKRTGLRPWLNTIIIIPTLIERHSKPHADDWRSHQDVIMLPSVTAGLYLFEWEVLSAFPGIFLCVIVRMCVCKCVCLWLEAIELKHTYLGLGQTGVFLKSDIFCAFLFFYYYYYFTQKKAIWNVFEEKKKKETQIKCLVWMLNQSFSWRDTVSLHGREDTGLCGRTWEEKDRQNKVMKNEGADLLGHFPLLTKAGLNFFFFLKSSAVEIWCSCLGGLVLVSLLTILSFFPLSHYSLFLFFDRVNRWFLTLPATIYIVRKGV